jgi:hypothetical protein
MTTEVEIKYEPATPQNVNIEGGYGYHKVVTEKEDGYTINIKSCAHKTYHSTEEKAMRCEYLD